MTTDELLDEMAVLMCFGGGWDARAKNCQTYGNGTTPRAAMLDALRVRDGQPQAPKPAAEPSKPRRRQLFDD